MNGIIYITSSPTKLMACKWDSHGMFFAKKTAGKRKPARRTTKAKKKVHRETIETHHPTARREHYEIHHDIADCRTLQQPDRGPRSSLPHQQYWGTTDRTKQTMNDE